MLTIGEARAVSCVATGLVIAAHDVDREDERATTAGWIDRMPDPDTFNADTVNGQQCMTGRSTTVHGFLDSIDALVRRHRALAARDGTDHTRHAELIAAELDQHAAVLRRSSHQFPY